MAAAPSPARLIRTVLTDPAAEQATRQEILNLAARNLHQPGVLSALVESLPLVGDTETRWELLRILATADPSRFPDTAILHDALTGAFRQEKQHEIRALLLDRLSQSLHQDARLVPFFTGLLADTDLDDTELAAAVRALTLLPSVPEDVAVAVLTRAVFAPTAVQERAVTVAEQSPRWDEPVRRALVPYLDAKTDRVLRRRILTRLVQGGQAAAEVVPALCTILRSDTDAALRGLALDLLGHLAARDRTVLSQVLWTSLHDADPLLRARAVALQKEGHSLAKEQLPGLASILTSDDAAGVRVQVLGILGPYLDNPVVRSAVLSAYRDRPAIPGAEEFRALVDLLAPFAGRDREVQETFLASWPHLARSEDRITLLDRLLPRMPPKEGSAWAARLFSTERNPEIRHTLFARLKGLSVGKNPDLAAAFCAELRNPGSPFRKEAAQSLALSPGAHADIVPAFEDVLLHDQDRELVRTCLDGYLRPGVARKFSVLLAVIGNEALDITSRQACIDRSIADGLSGSQAQQLAETVAASGTAGLRVAGP